MPPDPGLVAETKAWFLKAAADLRAAECDLAATPPLLEDAAFHCQQAAEKALKGFLTWHSVPFRKTHSLEEIGGHLGGRDHTTVIHACEKIGGLERNDKKTHALLAELVSQVKSGKN